MAHFLRTTTLALALLTSSAFAEVTDSARNPTLDAVLNCRAIADSGQRLACYDKSVEALQTANANRDIVVVDRSEMRKARRSLFGFNLPNLNIFGGDRDRASHKASGIDGDEDQISTTITSAHRDADGYWVIVIADGAVWHQTGGAIALAPRPGGAITIRKATLGSYFLRVGNQPGVKGRRDS